MNKYFIILIKTVSDKTTKAIYEADSLKEAEGTFHTEMGKCLKDDKCTYVMCTVLSANGSQVCTDFDTAEVI